MKHLMNNGDQIMCLHMKYPSEPKITIAVGAHVVLTFICTVSVYPGILWVLTCFDLKTAVDL